MATAQHQPATSWAIAMVAVTGRTPAQPTGQIGDDQRTSTFGFFLAAAARSVDNGAVAADPLQVSRTWPDRESSALAWADDGVTFASAIRTTITLTEHEGHDRDIAAPGSVLGLAFDPTGQRLLAAPYSFDLPGGTLAGDATDALTQGLPQEAARGFELEAAAADGRAIVLAGRYRPPRGLPPQSGWSGPASRIVLQSGDTPTVVWEGVAGDLTVACGAAALVAFADKTVRIVGRNGDGAATELGSGPAVARALAFDPAEERLAAGFADGTVIVWSIAGGTPTAQWQAQESDVWALAWPGDRLLTGGGDGSVRLFTADGTAVASTGVQQHRPITALAVHPDGRSALAAVGGPYPEVLEIDLADA